MSAATIGTLGVKIKKFKPTNLTSPDIINLHKELSNLKEKKIENVLIEASSHGLVHRQVKWDKFKAGIFTNLSQDHLDYHKSMKKYLDAKLVALEKLLKNNDYYYYR